MHEKKTLSFYDTYSEVKESLCFQDSEEIFSLDEKKVHQLLTDQPISYSKPYLPYFSCVFIIDKDSTIPLFFCKTVNLLINNKKYIRSKEDSLLVNPLAIETLSSLQVDLSFIKMTDDKSEIVFKIISSLKVMDLEKRIKVKFGLKFFKDNGLAISKKNEHITKKIKYFCGIPILKIKEYSELYDFKEIIPLSAMKNCNVKEW